jgi:hypothetical protein
MLEFVLEVEDVESLDPDAPDVDEVIDDVAAAAVAVPAVDAAADPRAMEPPIPRNVATLRTAATTRARAAACRFFFFRC